MIEVSTVNGWRRMLNTRWIVSISELSGETGSNTVISLSNGETVFVKDAYENVIDLIRTAHEHN
jgi:uncharacterized protein YlzI (FlbEa/FlbD family)